MYQLICVWATRSKAFERQGSINMRRYSFPVFSLGMEIILACFHCVGYLLVVINYYIFKFGVILFKSTVVDLTDKKFSSNSDVVSHENSKLVNGRNNGVLYYCVHLFVFNVSDIYSGLETIFEVLCILSCNSFVHLCS